MRFDGAARIAHAALVALALLALGASPAHADDASPPPRAASPYRFHVMLDAPIVLLGGAGGLAALVPREPPSCLPTCEPPARLGGLDARVLGNYSPAAHTAADLLVYALLLAPHAVTLVSTKGRDAAWLEDLVVTGESVLLAQGVTQVVKSATGRYAPIVYDESVPLDERTSADALGSFWSGHTATAFAAATSFAVSYWLRHPRDPWRWVVLATVESAALSVGLLKIRAGYHYPTDILGGAAAGIGTGLLVPMLHTKF